MKKVIKIITSIILVLILLVLLYFILCVDKVDEYSEYSREWLQEEINRTPLLVFPETTNDNVLSSDYLYYKNLNLLLMKRFYMIETILPGRLSVTYPAGEDSEDIINN